MENQESKEDKSALCVLKDEYDDISRLSTITTVLFVSLIKRDGKSL
jgi:hypothetical protein